jgi:DNA-binding response OmpR family regulator
MCQRVLAKEGFEVDIAVNGTLAQDMIGKKQYHICLIDIRTPKMNGTELYHWMQKKYPRLANQVIFTTGSVMDERTMTFIEQSGRPFLPKPFTPKELTAIVKKTLK